MSLKFDIILDGKDYRAITQQYTLIVLHHTGFGDRKDISPSLWRRLYINIGKYLAKKDKIYVSSNYLIGRKGSLTQIIDPDKHIAFHAGRSSFWNSITRKWQKGCNDFSIGVEIIGDGNKIAYTAEQYNSLAKLINHLMDKYPHINPNCIVSHEMISPGRKNDVGKYFEWRKLFELIYLSK